MGDALLFEGREYRLEVSRAAIRSPRITRDEVARALVVTLPRASPRGNGLAAALDGWYRARAREALTSRAERRAAEMNVAFARLAVRDQRTRWGSCSSRGNLNFSWRLVLAPPGVLDYVVVHELAHLLEANHGPRFWMLVERYCSGYRTHRRWLREQGPTLMALWR